MAFVLSGTNDPWGEEEPQSELMIKDEIAPFQILSRDIIGSTGHLEPFTEKELARQAQNGIFSDSVGFSEELGSDEDLAETLNGSKSLRAAQTGLVSRPSSETHGYMRSTDLRQGRSSQDERKTETSGRQPSSIPRRSVDHPRPSRSTVRTNTITTKNVQNRDGPSATRPTRSKSIGSPLATPREPTTRTNSQGSSKTSPSGSALALPPPSRVSPPRNTNTTTGGGSFKNGQNSRSQASSSTAPVGLPSKRRPAKSSSISRKTQPDSSTLMTPDGSYRLSMFDEFSVPPSSSNPPTENELRNWDEVVIPTVRKNLKTNPLSEWQDPLPISPSHRRLAQIPQISQAESGTASDLSMRKEGSSDVIEMNALVDRPTNDGTDGVSQPFDHRNALSQPPPSSPPPTTATTITTVTPNPSSQLGPALDSSGAVVGNDHSVSPIEQSRHIASLSHMNEPQPYRSNSSNQMSLAQAQAQNRERQYATHSEQDVPLDSSCSGDIGMRRSDRVVDKNTGRSGGKGQGRGRGGGDEDVKGGCAGCMIM